MKPFFKKEIHETRFLDPADEFREKVVGIEVRTDLFTGAKSRVLTHRLRMPDHLPDPFSSSQSEMRCPFCPENIDTSTPKFPPSIIPAGRIRRGVATVVPNAFPYSRYNAVVILSERHYLPLDHFTPEILSDAFQASLAYIKAIRQFDHRVSYASINWNYMPPAGGGIIHPHFQIVVDEEPTKFHRKLLSASSDYHKKSDRSYWADLVAFEEKKGHRHIFRFGKTIFLASYCPRGMFGEVLSLFERTGSLDELKDVDWRAFCEGLSRILSCCHRMHCGSLNMTFLTNINRKGHLWAQARIMPRISIPPLGISDVNYFEKGHSEVITVISPEEFAEQIRLLL